MHSSVCVCIRCKVAGQGGLPSNVHSSTRWNKKIEESFLLAFFFFFHEILLRIFFRIRLLVRSRIFGHFREAYGFIDILVLNEIRYRWLFFGRHEFTIEFIFFTFIHKSPTTSLYVSFEFIIWWDTTEKRRFEKIRNFVKVLMGDEKFEVVKIVGK